MPFQIVRNDITKMQVDAIVNAANNSLLGGGGVDGAIHRAAGSGLLAECKKLGGCETGDAKITSAYSLPCRWVIHTVGPVWQGGRHNEATLLASCYRRSLELADEKSCGTVAFPLISAGAYGYPKSEALHIAQTTITEYLRQSDRDMLVFLVMFDKAAFSVSEELFADIQAFIDDRYAEDRLISRENQMQFNMPPQAQSSQVKGILGSVFGKTAKKDSKLEEAAFLGAASAMALPSELQRSLEQVDESFSECLLRIIRERNLDETVVYKRANIDRKLFSKIRCDKHYRPKKTTALAFAIALEMNHAETENLLRKAGFSLTRSSIGDIIVEYYIEKKLYDVDEINLVLFAFDQLPLGQNTL